MRITTIPAVAVALLALAGCTPTTTEGRPVETAGSPASRLHPDLLAGTRPTAPPPHDPEVVRQVVAVEAAPPPAPPRVPSATGALLQAQVPPSDEPGGTGAAIDGSRIRGRGWPSDGPAAAAVVELERRFTVEGLAVLDVDVRPTADLDVTGEAGPGAGVGLEVVVVHTSGDSHPHQSVYLATLAENDGGWHIVELEARS
jgi:hypothetical protein